MTGAIDRLAALPARTLPGGLAVHRADTRRTRGRGLAGLPDLPPDRALHLIPCRSIHTIGMRFALDLLWLDGDGRLVRLDEAVQPRRMRTCLSARSVIEARAGSGTRVADALASGALAGGSGE